MAGKELPNMIIPTLGRGLLYEVNRQRAWLQLQAQKRKAFRYTIAIFTVIAIGVLAYILRPETAHQKGTNERSTRLQTWERTASRSG